MSVVPIPAVRVRHLVFFQTLAATPENSPDWVGLSLVFRALVLIDLWLDGADCDANDDGVAALRADSLAAVGDDPLIQHSHKLAAILAEGRDRARDLDDLADALLALGDELMLECRYDLASDVAHVALRLSAANDSVAWRAHRACGSAKRFLGKPDEATPHYDACIEIGERLESAEAIYWGRVGLCLIVQTRGNLPQAERLCRKLTQWTRDLPRADLEAHALHVLAITLGLRGRLHEAIECLERAVPAIPSSDRSRAIVNVGYMRLQTGDYSGARDIFLTLTREATDAYAISVAQVNLIEIYGALGDRAQVDTHRELLGARRLPPMLAVDFEMTLGRAYRKLGDSAAAYPCFDRAAALAHRAGMGLEVIAADHELEQLSQSLAERIHTNPTLAGAHPDSRESLVSNLRLPRLLRR